MTRIRNFTPQRNVRGNALLVAVILLLLASVITLLTLNVGLFEQRTSGNDARAKIISEVAEAGISQGAEYFRLKPTALAATSGNWQRCSDLADKSQFPCGSIPDVARRDTMYYWKNSASLGDVNGDGTSDDLLDQRMLPLGSVLTGGSAAARITTVGNFNNVAYGVGVVLCRIALPTSPGDPTRCTTVASEQSSTYVYNFVSVAGLGQANSDGNAEGTRTTVSQMLGQYQIFQPNMNMPPVIASGSVDVTGGLQLVTNPNGGGPGVPVSVWTRKDITKTGTGPTPATPTSSTATAPRTTHRLRSTPAAWSCATPAAATATSACPTTSPATSRTRAWTSSTSTAARAPTTRA